MRGVKSITSSNLALYVIDGVPMYNMMNGVAVVSMTSRVRMALPTLTRKTSNLSLC